MRAAVAIAFVFAFLLARTSAQDAPAASSLGIVAAVASTLERHPALEIQRQQVAISRAVKQQRTGAFDTRVAWAATGQYTRSPLSDAEKQAALASGIPVSALAERSFGMTAGAERLLRSGVFFGPTLSLDRLTDNKQTLDGINHARIGFDLTVPLLQGRGKAIVGGAENAAALGVEAAAYEHGQQAADLVLGTATSYWQYVASLRQLEIATASEGRGREYVDAVRTLVGADRMPRAELSQAQANFDSRAAGRFGLEQQVVEARSTLALAMGLPADQITHVPAPGDPLPEGLSDPPPPPDRLQAFVDLALARRADYLATEKKRQAAAVLRRVATNRVRPQLDLTFSTGLSNLKTGRGAGDFLGSSFTGGAGADAMVGVRWARPVANTSALGELAEAEASYQQAAWAVTEKGRSIAASVVAAVHAMQNGYARLAKTASAVEGFEAALEGERDKLRLGLGSLTDLLTVEGRLNDALTERVAAEQAYAVAVLQLRYVCGMLVDPLDPRVPPRDVFFRPLSGAGGQP